MCRRHRPTSPRRCSRRGTDMAPSPSAVSGTTRAAGLIARTIFTTSVAETPPLLFASWRLHFRGSRGGRRRQARPLIDLNQRTDRDRDIGKPDFLGGQGAEGKGLAASRASVAATDTVPV